ncbi:hypothetical protein EJ04DRAFT_515424 [Polyplosphaeria fusca]|uniref:Uncharacterized protein n=1 Tax=Polyplosphaeria fusca TaxID=682080 RepID=A0A9P4QP99_9PLEO|nr:hypothetical protein EJ04DRAFT_515424 [Polyplosphaeria fusca]
MEYNHHPQPFRANLFQPPSPPRASTDPAREPKKSHLHSLHHNHHRSHRHHHSRHAKNKVQSAVQLHPPTSFGDLLKPASKSEKNTPDQSRRQSTVKGPGHDVDGELLAAASAPKPVRPENVARERAIMKARENDLRSSLQKLSEHSLKTSRRLDDTYYSILEKVSVLRQMIGNLQELSSLTKELHANFQTDTRDLAEDVQGTFEGFRGFEKQQEQVDTLERRIKAGREKADALSKRLNEARTRVEERAKVEAEREARTTQRLRIFWGILGTVLGLVVIAILFQQLRPLHLNKPKHKLDFSSREQIWEAPIPEAAKEALLETSPTCTLKMDTPISRPVADLEDDKRLRIFDEL